MSVKAMSAKTKNFVLNTENEIGYPLGFSTTSFQSGIRPNRHDTAVLICKEGANWSGVVSQNKFRSLSLDDAISKKKIRSTLFVFFQEMQMLLLATMGWSLFVRF